MFVNETLVRNGFLGVSPDRPSLAISIELLEIYRQLRRVCPRLSLDALSRALCHIHRLPRQPYLADQISSAYDCYLELQRHIQARHAEALGRDSDWAPQNVCAPCMYKTVDEPPLKFSFLAAMDGNNSLKLVDSTYRSGSVRHDDRMSSSPRWISPEAVNVFKDEVNKKPPASPSSTPSSSAAPPQPDPSSVDLEEDSTLPDADTNTEDVANILAVCRHGHVLVMCDMIRSGELMKYPIAIIDRLLAQYGSDICMGYDIMCAFIKTLSRSVLGPKVAAFRLHGVVPSFHGHAHNRGCQLHWHPMYTEGVGLEDFEECERTFAKSNELASVTRLALPYHRAQHIDEHFAFMTRTSTLHPVSKFIFENYRQALDKIHSDSHQLAALARQLNTTDADYEKYLQAEREYLQSLKTEPKEVQQAVDYMEVLAKLTSAKYVYSIIPSSGLIYFRRQSDAANVAFQNLDAGIVNGFTRKQIINVKTRYRTTFTYYQLKEEETRRFEEEHGIEERWKEDSEIYRSTSKLLAERSYRRAVDNLERLVVQRLFELTKLGMNGVGYKLREKISKALRTRATAIHAALKHYNEAAALLIPPREPMTWSTVLKAATVCRLRSTPRHSHRHSLFTLDRTSSS
ncbi:hypothetical protein BJ912DRAFT_1018326 [Pholiota molesta]|nr:hypothetical protein BJ912DRAFT_1018326 [Pholiota molesta]